MASRVVYGIGLTLAISLFIGNVMVIELDLTLSRPMYLLLSFGYMSGFMIALFGALYGQSPETSKSHALKLGILLFALIVAVRQYSVLFRRGENATNVWSPLFGAMAFVIVTCILLSLWVGARKLRGKEGIAKWGVELQLASLVFFALAATLTCSLGALSVDSGGITMTGKVIALVNSESAAASRKVTPQEYGIVISYQVIGSWVVAVALHLTGNILELKSASSHGSAD